MLLLAGAGLIGCGMLAGSSSLIALLAVRLLWRLVRR